MQPVSLVGRQLGDFIVEEKLGQGGFGTVYRAHQKTLGREVVIKALHQQDDDGEQTERFLREAQLASMLDHPYAAHIYAFGAEDDGLLWIAMELVRGIPLGEFIKTSGSLPLHRFLPLFDKLCEVVHSAHQQNIIHRDIKPSNVMVLIRAGRLLPKLVDFGIARSVDGLEKAVRARTEPGERARSHQDIVSPVTAGIYTPSGEQLTQVGMSIGSPPYMAPEQWTDASQADARADQYSLGVLAYEALTGRLPFRAPNRIAMAMAHAAQPVPSLGEGFPPGLDVVLKRAMAKDPARRFPTVLDFAGAFRAAAAGDSEEELPTLDPALREVIFAQAPQPLADTVALLDAARLPYRAQNAISQVINVAARLVGLYAVAAAAQVGLGSRENAQAAREALAGLRQESFGAADWIALARVLVRPFASTPDTHPMPELVLWCYGPDGLAGKGGPEGKDGPDQGGGLSGLFAELAGPYPAGEEVTGEAPNPEAVAVLCEFLPKVERMLKSLSFLCDYPLLVGRGEYAEVWQGARRSVRPSMAVKGRRALAEGEIALASADGEIILPLSPLVQVLAPAPGAPAELFLFDGNGRFGARLVTFPVGFSRHDDDLWSWFREHLVSITDDEADDDSSEPHSPYMGLSAFSPKDADNYFGRERDVEACINRLRVMPFLAVVGASGAGKSSFVQAGIIPNLPASWRAVIVRPGPTPLTALAARLSREGIEVGDMRSAIERDGDTLRRALHAAADADETLVVVIDQFEELLTLCHDVNERELYAAGLLRAASSAGDPVRVIITLRDDFLLRAQQVPALRERLGQSLQLLATPPADELERILTEPARRASYEFEDESLPREMVAAVAGEPGALALLSFTASKLWELRDRRLRRLQRRAYKTLGGVGGALAQHAEETLAKMPVERQGLLREVFRQLVTADGTRAILSRSELGQMLGGDDQAEAVLEDLIHARLLVASESSTGDDQIEVVHEALLSSWPRLVAWQREDAENVRLRDQLRAAARQWVDRQRPKGLLWRGDALLEYRLWRARYRGSLTDTEEEFAQASVGDEARGRRRQRIAYLVVVVALALGMAVAMQQKHTADIERGRAERYAAESQTRLQEIYIGQGRQALNDQDPMRAFAYLAEARYSGADTPALRFLLGRTVDALRDQLVVLPGHNGALFAARFSPDNQRVATSGLDGTVKLWDASRGSLIHTLSGHKEGVWTLDFSLDGTRLITAGLDGVAKLWLTESGELLSALPHEAAVYWAGFDPTDTLIATASADRTAKLWDAKTGALIHTLAGHTGPLKVAAFSPSSRYLVTGSNDRTVRVWDVETGTLVSTSEVQDGAVISVAVSPDSKLVATVSSGKIARIFPILGGDSIILADHTARVSSVAFAPDGKRIVTGCEDSIARVWDVVDNGRLLFTLNGHGGGVTDAVFSPDGSLILTASRDGTARMWDSNTGRLRWTFFGHSDGLWSARFDSTGTRVVTAGFDGTARLWNAHKTGYQLALPTHQSAVQAASLSPDGKLIATMQDDGNVHLWDLQGRSIKKLSQGDYKKPSKDHKPYRVSWSPDGEWLITSGGANATIWNTRSGELKTRLSEHGKFTYYAAYSWDGTRIVTVGKDETAKIWNAEDSKILVTLQGHESEVVFADFAHTSGRIVTASADRTARIWDSATGKHFVTLAGHTVGLSTARFNADGTRLISTDEGKSAMIWNDHGDLIASLDGHSSGVNDGVFSPDGSLAATVSADQTLKVWDAISGTLLWSVNLHAPALSVQFSTDGQLLLVVTDKTAKVWNVGYDRMSLDEVRNFAACRVNFALDHGQAKRVQLDFTSCNRR